MEISKERYDYLICAWCEESEDPETQEWRDELTLQEARLVSGWDKAFNLGVKSLCEQFLHHEVECATRMHTPSLNV